MSIAATAVWRVRIAGNDANGAGYDSGIAGAGTDYSQQDAAQLSLTDIACSNTTTVTSATGGFTAAMIGNAVYITGGGATSGYYFITARTNTNTITVDRSPGTVAAGTGNVGGAAATFQKIMDGTRATGDKMVAGNYLYVRGSGSNNPTSADYSFTGYIQPVSGDTTNGCTHIVGENGRPRLQGNGLIFYTGAWISYSGLYLTVNSNSFGSNGIIQSGGNCSVYNCVVNTAGQSSVVAISAGHADVIVGCEIMAGTSTPAANAADYLVYCGGYDCLIQGCYLHHGKDSAVYGSQGYTVEDTIIQGCALYGAYTSNGASVAGVKIKNCVIDGCTSDGVYIASAAALSGFSMSNCNITNNGGYGLNASVGSAALNDRIKTFIDYNNYYGNSMTAYHNISAGAHDLAVNPNYVGGSPYDYTPANTALKGAAFPTAF